MHFCTFCLEKTNIDHEYCQMRTRLTRYDTNHNVTIHPLNITSQNCQNSNELCVLSPIEASFINVDLLNRQDEFNLF